MASVSGIADKLNNKYIVAVIVALFLLGIVRKFAR